MFLLRFITGSSFSGPLLDEGVNLRLWLGMMVCFSATLSVYILNGVMDVEEDRYNGSSRPMARGGLTTTQASGAVVGLALISLAGSWLLGAPMVLSVVVALILGWLYSGPPLRLKRWPAGLAAVAITAALITYGAGYTANGGGEDIVSLFAFAGIMALWMGLVGQTKDLSDVEGDKRAGRRSGPIAWGENAARRVISGLALVLGVGFVLLAVEFAADLLISAVIVLFGAVAVAVVSLGSWSRGSRARRRRPYRVFMLTQYGANLAIVAL